MKCGFSPQPLLTVTHGLKSIILPSCLLPHISEFKNFRGEILFINNLEKHCLAN